MSIIMMGAVPVIAPVSDDGNLDLEKVKNSITNKTKAILIINPNNPTGAIYSDECLREIIAIAIEKII